MNKKTLALLIMTVVAALVAGCGSSPDPIIQNQSAINNAKSLRSYYDASKGDFNALSPTDQVAAMKVAGGTAADVQKEFDFFKTSNKTAVKKQ